MHLQATRNFLSLHAGMQSTPASPAQRKKGGGQPPSQQQQQQADAATATAATPPTTLPPNTDLHSAGAGAAAVAAEQTHTFSTAAADAAGPSGLAEPVPATPALTGAAAAGAPAHDTGGKPTPSRSARRKAAKRLLIRTGVLPHKREFALARRILLVSNRQGRMLRCAVADMFSTMCLQTCITGVFCVGVKGSNQSAAHHSH